MSASNKLIQVKNLIGQILQIDKTEQKIPPEDSGILQDFLEGKTTIANAIKSIQKIKRLQTD